MSTFQFHLVNSKIRQSRRDCTAGSVRAPRRGHDLTGATVEIQGVCVYQPVRAAELKTGSIKTFFYFFHYFFSGFVKAAFYARNVSDFVAALQSPVSVRCPKPHTFCLLFAPRWVNWNKSVSNSLFRGFYLREKSRLLRCCGLPCLRRDMLAVQRQRSARITSGRCRGDRGEEEGGKKVFIQRLGHLPEEVEETE